MSRAPVRTCVGCRRRASQHDLVRYGRAGDGRLVAGRTLPGRGAWLCAGSSHCLAEAVRRRAFARALRAPGIDARIHFERAQPNVGDWSAARGHLADGARMSNTTTKG